MEAQAQLILLSTLYRDLQEFVGCVHSDLCLITCGCTNTGNPAQGVGYQVPLPVLRQYMRDQVILKWWDYKPHCNLQGPNNFPDWEFSESYCQRLGLGLAMHGWAGEWVGEWIDERVPGRMDGWGGGNMAGCLGGWEDGWVHGWTDEYMNLWLGNKNSCPESTTQEPCNFPHL